jgi:pimeloyl-ACP methyl ester carboxylesterase
MRKAVSFLLAASCLAPPICGRGQGVSGVDDNRKAIVVGFVGGFVRHDDARHAEVQFADHLRDRYRSAIDVEVFGNHSGNQALRYVLRRAAAEREPKIILFGHSWGATETISLARELEHRGIPVRLTIQVDSIGTGLLHGRSTIVAKDPSRTNILGNFEMSYKDHPVDCEDFPWYARVFTKPHIEIENDPRVWAEAASLIDSELSDGISTAPSIIASR